MTRFCYSAPGPHYWGKAEGCVALAVVLGCQAFRVPLMSIAVDHVFFTTQPALRPNYQDQVRA